MAKYNDKNEEIPDPTPVELPVGYKAPEPLEHLIARLIRNQEIQNAAAKAGQETFEESDDFEIDDEEPIMASDHQFTDMQEEHLNAPPQRAPEPVSTPEATQTSTEQETQPVGKTKPKGKAKTKPPVDLEQEEMVETA